MEFSPTNTTGSIRLYNGNLQVEISPNHWTNIQPARHPYDQTNMYIDVRPEILWCQRKMAEEQNIAELAKTVPAIQVALNSVNEAQNHLQMLVQIASGTE